MLTVPEAETRVADLVAAARRGGADAADALFVGHSAADVSVRLGALEDVGRSESSDIGLRVFVGRRSASVSGSDLSAAALAELVERAVAMAREAPEDPFAGLAPVDRLARDLPDLDLDDHDEPDPAALRARALAAEDAARGVAGVTNSEGAGASWGRTVIALGLSTGFARGYTSSSHGCSASVIAGEGGAMQRDYAHHGARHLADLEDAQAIGLRAGTRAVARLDPAKLESGAMAVLFDPRVSAGLLGHLAGAVNGAAVARRTSFLLDRVGTRIFAAGVTVTDDPHRPRGLRSKPFDGEGVATQPLTLVDDGVLQGWIAESASARQLGIAPTGHATRGIGGAPGSGLTNLSMAAGTVSREELIAGVEHGVLVTELIGQGVNGVTGDYSRGASGFLIRDGAIAGPVAEITVAGNLLEMFLGATPADDLEFRDAVNAPTVRIDGMTVAGA